MHYNTYEGEGVKILGLTLYILSANWSEQLFTQNIENKYVIYVVVGSR